MTMKRYDNSSSVEDEAAALIGTGHGFWQDEAGEQFRSGRLKAPVDGMALASCAPVVAGHSSESGHT
jgi:hypothetical protein